MRALLIVATLGLLLVPLVPALASPDHPTRMGARFGASTNWAGYAVETSLATPTAGAVTDVKGAWVVPAVDCTATGGASTYSAAWVGIDGYASNSVEQLGTESDCRNYGTTPYYAAWYEMYPKPSRGIAHTVHAGDHMTAEVSYSSGRYTLTMTDATAGWSFITTQKSNGVRSSAEWIIEAPWSGGVLPLANFGAIGFSAASATLSGHAGAISDAAWQADRIDMVNDAGSLKALTSALDPTGTAFTDAWVSAT